MDQAKQAVYNFWNTDSCGELYLAGLDNKEGFERQAKIRYELEPYILDFAEFHRYQQKKVLEIGVGLGSDHQKFAEAGAELSGIDLTDRAISYTKKRLQLLGLNSDLKVADAEKLSFSNDTFDLVYSWGVLHHSPDTPKAISEVFRVLKEGGTAKIMIYHKYSFVGYLGWLRHGLLKGKPFTSLTEIYDKYQESPGTKAYSVKEAREMFKKFRQVEIKTLLCHGDLLTSYNGQQHKGMLIKLIKFFWPRQIIKTFFKSQGFFMLINATK
ncbi:SAM dependent methyltransferase [Legionella lansingensis]|uniref:SAM dependent methyltransferase n=1 Tax=Legionella lansingensis TaxID=45067 RepID=A0A0W0VWE1_9GAMM|nr:class I SAM-dependent methyltransferase [Legionella lansingensis]KTD24328.1 SAM dependent methyltransferase [Legionella lansingensis]SNV51781.1 SAM dependent methyltransferase [Legionella lansingensis]